MADSTVASEAISNGAVGRILFWLRADFGSTDDRCRPGTVRRCRNCRPGCLARLASPDLVFVDDNRRGSNPVRTGLVGPRVHEIVISRKTSVGNQAGLGEAVAGAPALF